MMFAESLSPSDSLKADAPPALGTARLMDAPPVTIPFKSILFTIWMGGVLGLMALLIQRNVRFHRVVSANGKPAGESERKVAQLVTTEMKLGRSIPIIEIDLLETPAVVGLFNPKLLLPRRLALRLSDEDLGMIFWHEMAHVKRGDLWVNFLTSLLQIFHWMNPVLWWAFRRMRDDRELATDALVLSSSGNSRAAYGETLLKLASGKMNRTTLSPSIGILENHQHIRRRMEQISILTPNAYAWSALGTLLLAGLGLLALTKAPSLVKSSLAPMGMAQPSLNRSMDPRDLLKQIIKVNADALAAGCTVDSKWLMYEKKGANVPLNTERSSRVAVKGDYLISKIWVSAQYDAASKIMAPTKKRETQCAFNGQRYIATEEAGYYYVSKDPAKTGAIFDTLSSYPLTAMFAFLVPRQGWVSYGDLASSSNRNAYLADIKNISYDKSGDLVVTTLRSDGIGQEVTFSAAHDFYPSKIVMQFDKINESVTEVVDWIKTDLFGKNIQFVPKTISSRYGIKGNEQPFWEMVVDPQSLAQLPDTPHFFDLPITSGALITDEDTMKDVRAP
jgi:beta-lactamase regulating signal transducer with metallopeptidase domain